MIIKTRIKYKGEIIILKKITYRRVKERFIIKKVWSLNLKTRKAL